MVNAYLVYGLVDPRSGELRYVGKATRGVSQRMYGHLSAARRGKRSHVYNWLRQLLAAGLKPEVEVLERHETAEALAEAEKHFIAYFRSVGCNLTNATDGGEGTLGWVPSAEWRQRRSEFMKGKRYSLDVRPSEQTRRRLSESHKGKTTGAHADARRLKNSRSQGGRALVDQNGARYETQAEASRALRLSEAAISAVLLGKRSHHHGYRFTYAE